jgi:hypothetical protein
MTELLKPDIRVIGAASGDFPLRRKRRRLASRSPSSRQDGQRLPKVKMRTVESVDCCKQTGCKHPGAAAFGIVTEQPKIKFADVHRQIENVIATIAPNDSKERFTALGVRVVQGAARFKDAATLLVDDEDIEVRERRFVIAIGSTPTIPH